MAIYSGTWHNDDGVDFDPSSFPICTRGGEPITPTLAVTGDPVPDCTGPYTYGGTFGDLPYFKHNTEEFYAYFPAGPDEAFIAAALDVEPANHWVAAEASMFGLYEPQGTYAGEPIITLTIPFDLTITGDPVPDSTAVYTYGGISNGQPYWQHPTVPWYAYYLWGQWHISAQLGIQPADRWRAWTGLFSNTYEPQGTYTGDCAVAFALATTPQSGTCRQRIFGRRGGSGSPPGLHHGSKLQEHCRLIFGTRMRCYVDMPTIPPPDTWESAGQSKQWITRDGSEKKMHGQNFYPNIVVPKAISDKTFLDAPDLAAEAPPVSEVTAYYIPISNFILLRLLFVEDYNGDEHSGLSLFQVHPKALDKSWQLDHTQWVGSADELQGMEGLWAIHPFQALFDVSEPDDLRLFCRIWYKTAINWYPVFTPTGP